MSAFGTSRPTACPLRRQLSGVKPTCCRSRLRAVRDPLADIVWEDLPCRHNSSRPCGRLRGGIARSVWSLQKEDVPMPTQTTVLFGIPVPSANPLFLSVVSVHVLFGLAAVISGAVAMLSIKGRGRHSNLGTIYFWCLFGALATMSALAFARWHEDYHLFILGALSFGLAWLGRIILRRRRLQWPRLHLTSMATSYVLMITAFYVDNGRNLPLWRELPQIAFWILPALIAAPVIFCVLRLHPIVIAYDRSSKTPSAPGS